MPSRKLSSKNQPKKAQTGSTALYNSVFAALTVGLLLLSLPQAAQAGPGLDQFMSFVQIHIFNNVMYLFGGVALALGFYYGFKLIATANTESALSEAGLSVVYALFGFAVIALAKPFSLTFGGGINPILLRTSITEGIIPYLLETASAIFTVISTLAGIRMIASRGDTGESQKARTLLVYNVIGIVLMLAADAIVFSVSSGTPGRVQAELVGIGLFLLTIIGALSVVAIILSGIFLIVSVEDSLKERAKRTITGTLISLGVVMISYTVLISLV